jgi:hypothetical protein
MMHRIEKIEIMHKAIKTIHGLGKPAIEIDA